MSLRPTTMDRATFVATFGGVFEHSPWIAEAAWDAGLPADADTADGLHRCLCAALAPAAPERKLALLRAHPDLAGKLARAGRLTAEFDPRAGIGRARSADGRGAGHFHRRSTTLTRTRFGFPFIIAVKGRSKAEILAAFQHRIANGRDRSSRPPWPRSSGSPCCG